jgi:hypothetical protein
MNTLSGMYKVPEVLPQKRPVGEDAAEVPILLILVRMAVIVLIAAFVIGRLIVAFTVEGLKAHWPRGRMSHTQ